VHPQCPHCHDEKRFIDSIIYKYPEIEVNYYDITKKGNLDKMMQYAAKFDIKPTQLGTPILFTNDNVLLGFNNVEVAGVELERMFKSMSENVKIELKQNGRHERYLDLPIFGKVDLLETSLPILAVVIGLSDGFNPCAMWVLVYLISVIAGMNDKKKIWFLVGTFVLSSGILYFLFMTAWLNAFLYIGYTRILSTIIGLIALYMGTMALYEFVKHHGQVECKLSENKTRNRTMTKIKELATSRLSFISVLGIVGLAFVVNSIEFVCSFALPSVYTYVLSQANLSIFLYYMYILLYTLFFMLDDLVVFGLAAFAVNKFVNTEYAKYSHVIGGVVMFLIGFYLVFFNII
jgi:glutaredoxin